MTDTPLQAIRDRMPSARDYIPRHYPAGLPYSPKVHEAPPRPLPAPHPSLTPVEEVHALTIQLLDCTSRADHELRRLRGDLNPMVLAHFGPPPA